MMLLVVECIIACAIFTLIILPPLYKEPISQIVSFPPEIRRRVESLPQYKVNIDTKKKRHIAIKIFSIFIFAIMLALVAYYSGARSFVKAFRHVFIIFFAVNLYDLFVLDIGLFCHSKKTRISGTEDMDEAYRNPKHHIRGAIIGTFLGVVVTLLSGGLIYLYRFIYRI
ncbi:hypothetical protein [Tissierella sp.]|uniref:hypothetical protein n=1 Tax=Tissierella sp. TaxID=41274 RepID=UPI0030DCEFFB